MCVNFTNLCELVAPPHSVVVYGTVQIGVQKITDFAIKLLHSDYETSETESSEISATSNTDVSSESDSRSTESSESETDNDNSDLSE